MIGVLAAAIFFGCIAFLGAHASGSVCSGVTPASDGPIPGTPPTAVLVAAAAVVGGLLLARGAAPIQLAMSAIVVFALVASWCSDVLCGIVPDVFTLVPLAAIVVLSMVQRDWGFALSALVPFAPFAIAAFFSHGYGMGWGDAKLVAISGAALGVPLVLITLAIACVAAVIGHRIAGAKAAPIAFAPYIAALTGIALPLGMIR